MIISTAFALISVEGVLRVFPYPQEALVLERCNAYAKDTGFNYSFSHAYGAYPPNAELPLCNEEFLNLNKSDSLGYLGFSGFTEGKQHDLLVFGDSFAYGFGVSQDQTFASLLKAYNAGLWGNSFHSHARAFRQVVDVVKPVHAIWEFFPPHLITVVPGGYSTKHNIDKITHPICFAIVEQYNKTRLSKALLALTGIGFNRTDYYTWEWTLYDPEDHSEEPGYAVFEKAVEDVVAIAKDHNIEIIPVFMPSKAQILLNMYGTRPLFVPFWHKLDPNIPINKMAAILVKHGVPKEHHINLLPAFSVKSWQKMYFRKDAHLNAQGHKFVAEIIAHKLNENKIIQVR